MLLQQKLSTAKKEYNILSNMYDTAVEMRDLIFEGSRVQLKKAKAQFEAYTQSLKAEHEASTDKVCAYRVYTLVYGCCVHASTAVCALHHSMILLQCALCCTFLDTAVCTVLLHSNSSSTKHTSSFYTVLLYTTLYNTTV
jgi:hypothetical protein